MGATCASHMNEKEKLFRPRDARGLASGGLDLEMCQKAVHILVGLAERRVKSLRPVVERLHILGSDPVQLDEASKYS